MGCNILPGCDFESSQSIHDISDTKIFRFINVELEKLESIVFTFYLSCINSFCPKVNVVMK